MSPRSLTHARHLAISARGASFSSLNESRSFSSAPFPYGALPLVALAPTFDIQPPSPGLAPAPSWAASSSTYKDRASPSAVCEMRQSSRNLCKSLAYNSASEDVTPRHARASARVVRVAVTARSPIWSASPSTTKPHTLASTASAALRARPRAAQQSTSRAPRRATARPACSVCRHERRPGDLGVDGDFWGVLIGIRARLAHARAAFVDELRDLRRDFPTRGGLGRGRLGAAAALARPARALRANRRSAAPAR